MRISTTNRIALATISASSDAGGDFAAANLTSPQRPFKGARTAGTGAQNWVADLGSALSMGVFAPIHCNFATCSIQADDAATFNSAAGLPQFDSGTLTNPRNLNERFQVAHVPGSTITRRYVRLSVPSQTPLDGAPYYRCGGLWAGPLSVVTPLPKSAYALTKVEPHEEIALKSGGGQRVELGDPLIRLALSREASDVSQAPVLAGTDELSIWAEVDRLLRATGFGLVLLRDEHPGMTWVMRSVEHPTWDVDTYLSRGRLTLEEMVR